MSFLFKTYDFTPLSTALKAKRGTAKSTTKLPTGFTHVLYVAAVTIVVAISHFLTFIRASGTLLCSAL